MSMSQNIWGTTAAVSIASAVEAELCVMAASVDGIMVEQVITAAGMVYRSAGGYALELCGDHVRIYRAGMGSRYATLAVSMLTYAGDYSATADEIDAARMQDEMRRAA